MSLDVQAADIVVFPGLRLAIEVQCADAAAQRLARALLERADEVGAFRLARGSYDANLARELESARIDPAGPSILDPAAFFDAVYDAWRSQAEHENTLPTPLEERSARARPTPSWDVPMTVRVRARTREAASDRLKRWAGELERRGSVEDVEVEDPYEVEGRATPATNGGGT